MMPTLRQLEYLVSLAETGQFIEAARQCAVSQPALSKQIREVEEMLGLLLFERARPKVLLTPAGKELLVRAKSLLAAAREFEEAARVLSGAHQKVVRLGVIPTIAPYGLPGFLVKLRRQFPDVSFVIRELQTEVLLDELRAGAIDLALLARPFDDYGLAGEDLVFEPFVLLAPEGHPLSVHETIEPAEVAGTNLILMEDGHCLRDQAIEVCALAEQSRTTDITAASISTLVRMVESGLGATLLPASALRVELRPELGLLARSFKAERPPGRTLTLQWRQTAPNHPWLQEIAQILKDHYLAMNASMPAIAGPLPQIEALQN